MYDNSTPTHPITLKNKKNNERKKKNNFTRRPYLFLSAEENCKYSHICGTPATPPRVGVKLCCLLSQTTRERPNHSGLKRSFFFMFFFFFFCNKCLLLEDHDVITEFLCIVQNTDTSIWPSMRFMGCFFSRNCPGKDNMVTGFLSLVYCSTSSINNLSSYLFK